MRSSYLLCASLLPIMAALLPGVALAQQSPAPPAAGATEVGEVIVTAQRVAQSLQRVPVSVQAIGGQVLEERKLNDIIQLQTSVPSLQTSGDNTISLRGVGTLVFTPNLDSSVGVAVDEVSLAVPTFMNNFGFEDVGQIEVLLGPQGLLFGRNASAGLLNIVTRKPVLGEFSGRVYGEYDYRDSVPGDKDGGVVRGTVNLPLGDIAALRVNALYSYQNLIAKVVAEGPNADVEDYQKRAGVKAKLLIEPNDQLSIYLIGDYFEQSGAGGIYDRTFRHIGAGSLTGIFVGLDGVTPGAENLEWGASTHVTQDLKGGGLSANITWRPMDGVTVNNITAWKSYDVLNDADIDFTSFDGVDENVRTGTYSQFSNELRVAFSGNDFIDGQAGLFYFSSRIHEIDEIGAAAFGAAGPGFDSHTNPLFGLDFNSRIKADSLAGFGQVNIHPTEALTLIVGGRYTHDEQSIDLVQNQYPYPIPLGVPNASTKQSIDNDNFSWKLGAQFAVTPDIMAYATYSKGYKGPAFNDTIASPGQDLSVGPETVKSTEFGVKSMLFDRRLRLNITAFHSVFSDFQVSSFDPATTTFYAANAAQVKSQGVEIFAEGRPISDLTLSASVTFLDSRFESFKNDKCYAGQAGCSPAGVIDSSGNRTPSSAKFVSSLGAVYERPLSDNVTLVLAGDWYHRSSINFASNGNPLTRLGPIDVLGASLSARFNDNLKVSLFCKNCTDKIFPVFIGGEALDATLLNVNSTGQSWGYNSVRTVGVSLSYDF
ncbi:MAG: TonB-dependent receptor [Caulobacter sp.]|nr:TonB-dependent receptor [Caulobacter sp.]